MKKVQDRIQKAAVKDVLLNSMTTVEVAKKYNTTPGTISKWCKKWMFDSAFLDELRSSASNEEKSDNIGGMSDNIGGMSDNIGGMANSSISISREPFTYKYEDGKFIFTKQISGKVITPYDYEEWTECYNRLIKANEILF